MPLGSMHLATLSDLSDVGHLVVVLGWLWLFGFLVPLGSMPLFGSLSPPSNVAPLGSRSAATPVGHWRVTDGPPSSRKMRLLDVALLCCDCLAAWPLGSAGEGAVILVAHPCLTCGSFGHWVALANERGASGGLCAAMPLGSGVCHLVAASALGHIGDATW